MTNNNLLIADSIALAAIAIDSYYSDLLTPADLDDFADDADSLNDALSDDIADLIHNGNECDLFPAYDDLDDADALTFSRRFDDDSFFDEFIAALADMLRNRADADADNFNE